MRCNNEPKLVGSVLMNFAVKHQIETAYTQPKKSKQNGNIDTDNRSMRYDWVNQILLRSVDVPDTIQLEIACPTINYGLR